MAAARADRRSPSAPVQAEEQGDHLSEQELRGTLALLLAAGNETTTNLIGNGVAALLRHPDQLAQLREEPAIAEGAVEELIRFDSPVQLTMRIPTEDVDFGGVRFDLHQTLMPRHRRHRDRARRAERLGRRPCLAVDRVLR